MGRFVERRQCPDAGEHVELRLAVPRRVPGGGPEPGVVYLDLTVARPLTDELERLAPGALVAVSALVEVDEQWQDGELRRRQELVAESLELLER